MATPYAVVLALASRRTAVLGLALALVAGLILVAPSDAAAQVACDPPANPVVCENAQPGSPASEWDVSGAGSSNIQGFATDISVDQGQTVRFKIDTPARSYRLDIYRMGYYGGAGARKVATVDPSASLPQNQPDCLYQSSTGLTDCGNWAESASWPVPSDAVSGIYFAKLVRTDGTSGSSHVVFVVRDDDGGSEVLFQTADTTWQAYNAYGGNSLYVGSPAGRAYKVSYNRPFTTRGNAPEDWVFNAEYPMVRWLERNGYDVSYTTGVDSDRSGPELLEHDVFLSVGHDEYWSGQQRANVEAARDAGVHLGFFSGNDVFWKTRWESSIDGSGTAHRTLVTYKETHANAKIDPSPEWTGTWRDPRFSPPSDGGRPENGLSGTLFTVNCCTYAIRVPEAEGKMRLWRNTTVATLSPGQTATFPSGTLGYEWNEDLDNGHRPPGLVRLSSTTVDVPQRILDYGSSYGSGTATHALTLYKAPSGARVFSAGTIQWSWGLDDEHDRGSNAPDARMQQATVNLLADMGVQPGTLQNGLAAAAATTDSSAPTTVITSPADGADLPSGQRITIEGTASDTGGRVAAVEVSVDDGQTWRPATGRESWSYSWTPFGSSSTVVRARAIDDSGNYSEDGTAASVTVGGGTQACPCTIFGDLTPAVAADPDTTAVELGVRFQAAEDGVITGIRFYKSSQNTGTHVGSLWTNSGQRLADVTFSNETGSGWQQASFAEPVPITAGTTYVASYHAPNGRYSIDQNGLAQEVSSGMLRALASGASGANGVYSYGSAGTFPTESWNASNYWVDVVFDTEVTPPPPDTTPPSVTVQSPAPGATGVPTAATVSATFDEAVRDDASLAFTLAAGSTAVPGTTSYDSGSRTATFTPGAALASSTTYTASVEATDTAGNPMTEPVTWTFTTADGTSPPPDACPCTIFGDATPAVAADPETRAVELGVRFRAAEDGVVTGIRFHKSSQNTGTHVASLWTDAGARLAEVTFANETGSGWQQASFAEPVPITAGTTYVASYHAPNGRYSLDEGFFTEAVTTGPLTALADGTTGANGVYSYGSAGTFPTDSWNASNYWVDVVFDTEVTPPPSDTTPPSVTGQSPAPGATDVATAATVSATFDEAVDEGSVAFSLSSAAGTVLGATSYDSGSRTVTFTPAAALAAATTYTASVSASDVAGNAMAEPVTWSFTTADPPPSDTTPPSVTGQSPAPGATDVATAATVSATFDEAVDEGSVAFSLSSAAGTVLGATSYDSGSRTVTFTPAAALAAATTYTASVSASDVAGNAMAEPATWSFTTADPPPPDDACPCTIFDDATPAVAADSERRAVEVGVRFRASQDGLITGVRFYKGTGNTGTHVGSLWTNTGTRLASVTFTGETSTGWQQATLAEPVPVTAGTTYVASYHAPNGRYAIDVNGFSGSGVTNGPLTALANGTDGANGIYRYGSTSRFPTQSWRSSNYWVDVVFSPSGG